MPGNFTLAAEILEIVWINILLSGDNAVLIALACRGLPKNRRRLGVLLGALFGVLLRVGFTLIVFQLLGIPYLKIIGALLLLAVAIKLPNQQFDHSKVEAKPDLVSAVTAIVVADAVMSLDNVVAIAAAAHGSLHLILFGLAISAPIVMFGAGALMEIFDRVPESDLPWRRTSGLCGRRARRGRPRPRMVGRAAAARRPDRRSRRRISRAHDRFALEADHACQDGAKRLLSRPLSQPQGPPSPGAAED